MIRSEPCRDCGEVCTVATCDRCGRSFVVTVAHIEGRERDFGDGLATGVVDRPDWLCDVDRAKDASGAAAAVAAGLRQRTCASCHSQLV